MKENIIQELRAVIQALDTIPVTGQQNRGNLYGSIAMLEKIVKELTNADFDGGITTADSFDD